MSIVSSLLGGTGRAGADVGRVIVIGTPRTVRQVRDALRSAGRGIRPVGCVLLNEAERGGRCALRVLGTADQLDVIVRVHRIDTALASIPVAMASLARRVTGQLNELGVTCRRMPTLDDQLDGRVEGMIGPVDAAALLDRPPHRLDDRAIGEAISGKRILITGAGGSIGSQLAHIAARYRPDELILMERSENGLFEIDRELAAQHPLIARRALLHDVVDVERTAMLCRRHRPHVVFHAAAHKHVPMMEDHPAEAVGNNLFGTRSIADAAVAVEAERFVMISTDKAVHPTSVMGATKRLAELYVQDLSRRAATRCSIVRFGNVLGSACSVVPIWSKQLQQGGPITVTDPRMTRYFMTITEAASLVIQAASLDEQGGRIHLLDMGRPIRIVDLAERFIRLHGLEPRRDVAIVFSGARPGEKLHEELVYAGEDHLPTGHEAIHILRNSEPPDAEQVRRMVERLQSLRGVDDRNTVLAALWDALSRADPGSTRPGQTLPPAATRIAPTTVVEPAGPIARSA